MEKPIRSNPIWVCTESLKEIMRVAANTIVVLAGAYLIHELIQQRNLPCPDCYRARFKVVSDGAQNHKHENQGTGFVPHPIKRATAYVPGIGD